ncbi:uncharacterized protein LOC120352831 [Nilaparvata lugens]|uniref:uncharacterized protein LOC120352831 n=1 Tax=Nilaparvata lugens TaxID=108931 RepID=UPI00193E24C6|nr:uncharacterized protein LOC120352831 [Nilaparvata lugens]
MDRPGRIVRNQIDFLLVNRRFWNSCISVKTYPGADIQSDHTPLVGRFKVRLERVTVRKVKSYDLRRLKDPVVQQMVRNDLNERLRVGGDLESVEGGLAIVKETVKGIKDQYLRRDPRKCRSWMTDEILELMELRKSHKDNLVEYRRIHTIIRRKIREAKEREKVEQCQGIELYQSHYDSFNVHRKVKEVAGEFFFNKSGRLADVHGNLVIDKDERKKVWEQYLKDLFHDLRAQQPVFEDDTGPKILLEEVKAAMKQMEDGKATGSDEISIELLKLMDEENMKTITNIVNHIYSTGKIPNQWLESEFIAIPKKSSAKACGDFQTLSLMSNMLEVFLKVIHKRIYNICEEQISPNQFGFVKAVGTREALFGVQVLFQRCRDVG